MLLAWGWAHIQAPMSVYEDAKFEDLDRLDTEWEALSTQLYGDLQEWLSIHCTPWLVWHFKEGLNNDQGLLLYNTSRNHRYSGLWNLFDFIAHQSAGNYGLAFVHDDEDHGVRTGADFTNSYRVWRVLDGQVTEHEDAYFSPFSSKNAFPF